MFSNVDSTYVHEVALKSNFDSSYFQYFRRVPLLCTHVNNKLLSDLEHKYINETLIKLKQFQNPNNCTARKKLICTMAANCGLGCELFHLTYCFATAYGTNRTMVVKFYGLTYGVNNWNAVFKPFSDTCPTAKIPQERWISTNDLLIIDSTY